MPDADGPPAYGPPPPAYKPAPKYAPAPAPYAPPKHAAKEHPPQPYAFEYGVADQYSGTNFQAVENQDEKGTVIGKFCLSSFTSILVHFCNIKYIFVPFSTFLYHLVHFSTLRYILVHFGTF